MGRSACARSDTHASPPDTATRSHAGGVMRVPATHVVTLGERREETGYGSRSPSCMVSGVGVCAEASRMMALERGGESRTESRARDVGNPMYVCMYVRFGVLSAISF